MKKSTKMFILVFGLYLGWILSFLYEGPLFSVILNLNKDKENTLVVVMHFLPIIIIALSRLKYINKKNDKKVLIICIVSSMLLSIIFIIIGKAVNSRVHFQTLIILCIFAGIIELLFIISATGMYIRYIPMKYIFISMAYITLIANCIVLFCNLILYFRLNNLSIVFLLLICITSFVLAILVYKDDEVEEQIYNDIQMPKYTILLMSGAFYLFNIGGGIVFGVINPCFNKLFPFIKVFNIIPYIIFCIITIILLKKEKLNVEFLLVYSIGLIIIGLIIFQFINNKWILLITNIFIQSGYAIMDIYMWGKIGVMSFVYNKPYKIVYYTMSANVLGVFTGVLLSNILKGSKLFNGQAPIMIALISTVLGMLIVPIIHKRTLNNLESHITFIQKSKIQQQNLKKITKVETLTVREKEIANFLILDITNKKIAEKLFISENTLKKHAKNIYAKLEVKNKKELKLLLEKKDSIDLL